jgi:hypothetical protein
MSKKFADMTPKNKRIAIAKDVLTQLAAKKLRAAHGIYLEVVADGEFTAEEMLRKPCTVCALGGLFVACTNKVPSEINSDELGLSTDNYDGFTETVLNGDSDSMKPRMQAYFTREQLRLIEHAFEKRVIETVDENNDEYTELELAEYWEKNSRAMKFKPKVVSPNNRLKAIMENVIENNGTFVP